MNYHIKSAIIQMNEPWSIPRASLGGSIASSSQSNSQNSSVKIHTKKSSASSLNREQQSGQTNRGYYSEGSDPGIERHKQQRTRQPSKTLAELQNKFDELKRNRGGSLDGAITGEGSTGVKPKRGSRSSQGSTDSNHSSHSASSGSLLLTAANLERFTQIHHNKPVKVGVGKLTNTQPPDVHPSSNYKTNITLSQSTHQTTHHHNPNDDTNDSASITIDHNHLMHANTKDIDTVSLASSTHFTMVNGMHPQRKVKDGICSRGHQITILILSMSFIFLVIIIGMVYLFEMRAREMPHS